MNPIQSPTTADYTGLVGGISELLEAARRGSAHAVNAFMTATYWEIGRRIVEFEQGGEKRAEYGKELLMRLAGDLTTRFGRGFSRQNLQRFRQFYLSQPAGNICSTLSGKLDGDLRPLSLNFTHADAGQMHLYLNYAREHWVQPGENPPIGVILCSDKSEALVRYATDALPNKLVVREYLTALPDEKLLAAEMEKTRKQMEFRR